MSPGMTMTPGIGGTTNCCPLSGGTCSVKPTTLRFGTWVWMLSVSGMIVRRLCSCGAWIDGMPTWPPPTSVAPCSVGSTTGKSILICES